MRLFAGIELDDATRAMCVDVQRRLQLASFGAKYENAEKLHITLAFLGTVRDDQFAGVTGVLETISQETRPFDLALDRAGAFPNERRPRIAFVGSRAQGPAFRTLVHRLHDAYRELGFNFKEDPVAHVTIARVKGGSPEPLPMLELAPHTLAVRAVVLFESLPGEGTTRYEIRERFALSA